MKAKKSKMELGTKMQFRYITLKKDDAQQLKCLKKVFVCLETCTSTQINKLNI